MKVFKIIYGICLFLLIMTHLCIALASFGGFQYLKPDLTEGNGSTNYEKFITLLTFQIYGGSITPVIVSLFQPLRIVKQYALAFPLLYHTSNSLILPFWQKKNRIFIPNTSIYDGFIYLNIAVVFHIIMANICWTLFLGVKDNMILPTFENETENEKEQQLANEM